MFENWTLFIGSFMGFILLGFLIYLIGNRSFRPEGKKGETYTCGEPFQKVSVTSDNFYQAIIESMGLNRLRDVHTGNLSDYVIWMVVGIVMIVIMVLVI
ncbi:MAG: hypothetical protein JW754_00245 [Candidatus Aenigmarchaeota archaeon]|nr:hypothetical protein [Candidatus Aenigmarchaeota archaeon]